MKLRYIESWCTEIELTEEDLESLELEGLSAEEVAEYLTTEHIVDEPDSRLMPSLFEVRKHYSEPIYWPKSGTEIYNTEWEALG